MAVIEDIAGPIARSYHRMHDAAPVTTYALLGMGAVTAAIFGTIAWNFYEAVDLITLPSGTPDGTLAPQNDLSESIRLKSDIMTVHLPRLGAAALITTLLGIRVARKMQS